MKRFDDWFEPYIHPDSESTKNLKCAKKEIIRHLCTDALMQFFSKLKSNFHLVQQLS
jgi:hypothetical protein